MSGAARAAWPADSDIGMGTGSDFDSPVLTAAILHHAPRDARPATADGDRHARLTLVMPADAAMHVIASAAACDAEAGVC